MRSGLLVLMAILGNCYAQSAFPSTSPATLASYLPVSFNEFERWSLVPRQPYVPKDARPIHGLYRTQVQTIQETFPSTDPTAAPCTITAAGILYTCDQSVRQEPGTTLLVEITDYGNCRSRIVRDTDHFSQHHTQTGQQESHRFFLEPGIKAHITRDIYPGGELRAVFLIRDRFQVYMKLASSAVPPVHFELTGMFRTSTLYQLLELIPDTADTALPPGQHTRSLLQEDRRAPLRLAEFQASSATSHHTIPYSCTYRQYENNQGDRLSWYVYEMPDHGPGWSSFMAEVTASPQEYAHIGTMEVFSRDHPDIQGVLRQPKDCFGALELVAAVDEKYFIRLLAEGCRQPDELVEAVMDVADRL